MAARFWVGGSATWDAATTANWSTTLGGAGGASVPTASDDVTVDTGSTINITVGASYTAVCLSLTTSGAGSKRFFAGDGSSKITVSGNCTLPSVQTIDPQLTVNATSAFSLSGGALPDLVISAGTCTFSGATVTTNSITVSSGATLTTTSTSVSTVTSFSAPSGSTLTMGSGAWTMPGTCAFGGTVSSSSATLILQNAKSVSLSGLTFAATQLDAGGNGGTCTITCSGAFTAGAVTLIQGNISVPPTGKFTVAFDSTVTATSVAQQAGGFTAGRNLGISGGTLSVASGTVALRYCDIANNTATGGAAFYASDSHLDGNSPGWNVKYSDTMMFSSGF